MTPKRIQLRRSKGWRKPAGAVVVSRPSKFGNPFTAARAVEVGFAADLAQGRELAVKVFRAWLAGGAAWWVGGERRRARILEALPSLRGKDLCCWCPPGRPCHADVLLDLANRRQKGRRR